MKQLSAADIGIDEEQPSTSDIDIDEVVSNADIGIDEIAMHLLLILLLIKYISTADTSIEEVHYTLLIQLKQLSTADIGIDEVVSTADIGIVEVVFYC